MQTPDPYLYFLSAVYHFENRHGTGYRKALASICDLKPGVISTYLGSPTKPPKASRMPMKHMVTVAAKEGLDLVDFMDLGRRLLNGDDEDGPGDPEEGWEEVYKPVSHNDSRDTTGYADPFPGETVRAFPEVKPEKIPKGVSQISEKGPEWNSPGDFLRIPAYVDHRLEMEGCQVQRLLLEEPDFHVALYADQFPDRRGHQLVAFRILSGSMSPTIPMGSIVAVDLSDRKFLDNQIYLVKSPKDGSPPISLKRVAKFSGGYTLFSDNPTSPPKPVNTPWQNLCQGRAICFLKSLLDG